jgi:hypothetical protein
MALVSLLKIRVMGNVRVEFNILNSIPFITCLAFCQHLHNLEYCHFMACLKSGSTSPLILFFLDKVLVILGPLNFHTNFRNKKEVDGILT